MPKKTKGDVDWFDMPEIPYRRSAEEFIGGTTRTQG
jgi:hypothetical protein